MKFVNSIVLVFVVKILFRLSIFEMLAHCKAWTKNLTNASVKQVRKRYRYEFELSEFNLSKYTESVKKYWKCHKRKDHQDKK